MRMPPGFHRLIAAQFASALADNALLIVTIALLAEQGLPAWWAPLLKFGFTLSYVLLAPLLGPLADAWPKARLMAAMNGLKMLGLALMLSQLWHPVAAYALVGLGAAAYAPAKYGLLTEIVPPHQLVAANAWVEVSIVGAALLGTMLGGLLLSPWLAGLLGPLQALLQGAVPGLADSALILPLLLLLLVYGLAALLQWGLPDSGARYARSDLRPRWLLAEFAAANRRLWQDAAGGGLSLAVTTLFWGVGATLQFAVLRWAEQRLGLRLEQGAYLQAAVAGGVILGAWAAGRWVPLARARQLLPVGVLLGLLIAAMGWIDRLALALPMLVLVGAVGGLLVVPMNALLQHRGCRLLTAGRSIAVQGFNENLSILVMLGLYAGALALQLPLLPLMSGFGLLIAGLMLVLMRRRSGLPLGGELEAVRP